MKLPRAPLFLAERLISQGGGLLFAAILVRTATPQEAAGFFAAYAFAAVFQPVLSNAVQPIVARYWRSGGRRAVIRIWALMQGVALVLIGPMIWIAEDPVAALLLLHAMLAPGLVLATPLAAEDRRQTLVFILMGVTLLGVASRTGAYLATGDLRLAVVFFAVEPVLGGAAFLFATRRLRPSHPSRPPKGAFFREAAVMALAMGATTLFWRSPLLLADQMLGPEEVVALALAMQIVMGLCLPGNALCQSLFGPLAKGDRAALGVGVWLAIGAGIGAPLLMLAAGEAIMSAFYGPAGQGAALYATLLAPMAGLAALWRLGHLAGGLAGLTADLALTRAAALSGQALLAVWLIFTPSALAIAAMTPVSMLLAAVIAPLATPRLRSLARDAAASARLTAFRQAGRKRALRLMFS